MKLDLNGIMCALSFALDEEEAEFFDIRRGHGKRVALIATFLGEHLSLNSIELSDLAILCILHDNALTQYHSEEVAAGHENLGFHCITGEKNLVGFPFHSEIKNAILHHHERPDGKGVFKKKDSEISLYAKLIHFADTFDLFFNSSKKDKLAFETMIEKVRQMQGKEFSNDIVDVFLKEMTPQLYELFLKEDVEGILNNILNVSKEEYSFADILEFVNLFAKIVDFKSEFTSKHSLGIANKAYKMGSYYHFSNDICEKLYIAGAFHDIGKMAIKNEVLEKPDKLTNDEFVYMKNHAYYTYEILSRINGWEDICEWASLHHEKLDGSGYPFGKKACDLSLNSRLLACLDIFQALSEDRPYKMEMSNEEVKNIMLEMVRQNKIDGNIVKDIFVCFNY